MEICFLMQKCPTEILKISIGHLRTKTLAHKHMGKLKQKGIFPLKYSYFLKFLRHLLNLIKNPPLYGNSDYRLYGSRYEPYSAFAVNYFYFLVP